MFACVDNWGGGECAHVQKTIFDTVTTNYVEPAVLK